jgi:SAM-dependent methyltransferase
LRGLEVRYEVMDITELPHEGRRYDLIVDSYCLQGIVTDDDRHKVFAAMRARLKPEGYYLVSSAMFDPQRMGADERIVDGATGTAYARYGEDGIIDPETGIVYSRLDGDQVNYDGVVQVGGTRYLLNRRHHTAPALHAEIEGAGFRVLYQDDGYGGNLICVIDWEKRDADPQILR